MAGDIRCKFKGCAFPGPVCSYHRHFFDFPVSMTDTALDLEDVFGDEKAEPKLYIASRTSLSSNEPYVRVRWSRARPDRLLKDRRSGSTDGHIRSRPQFNPKPPTAVDVEDLRADFKVMNIHELTRKHRVGWHRVYRLLEMPPRPTGVRLGLERDEQAILDSVRSGMTFEEIKRKFKIGSKRLRCIAGHEFRGCSYCTHKFQVTKANQKYCSTKCSKRAKYESGHRQGIKRRAEKRAQA